MAEQKKGHLDLRGGIVALLGLALVARGWSGLHGDSYIPYISARQDLLFGALVLLIVALRSMRENGGK